MFFDSVKIFLRGDHNVGPERHPDHDRQPAGGDAGLLWQSRGAQPQYRQAGVRGRAVRQRLLPERLLLSLPGVGADRDAAVAARRSQLDRRPEHGGLAERLACAGWADDPARGNGQAWLSHGPFRQVPPRDKRHAGGGLGPLGDDDPWPCPVLLQERDHRWRRHIRAAGPCGGFLHRQGA